MSEINDLLAMLPARVRFSPQLAERAAYDQALERGWTTDQIAEAIIGGVGPNATSPSGLAVHILRSTAGQPPPPPPPTSSVGRPPGLPMPECRECGQPYGDARGGRRPQPGDKGVDCRACNEPLVLVQWDPRRQAVMT
jgi:hypothetical protein